MVIEPILSKAARKLGIDQVAIHRVNAPEGKATFGPANPRGQRAYATSAFVKETLDRGMRSVPVGGAESAGRQAAGIEGARLRRRHQRVCRRLDRLRRPVRDQARWAPVDSVGHRQSGNRVDERLPPRRRPRCSASRGRKSTSPGVTPAKNLPWSCVSGGSQTLHAHTRAAHAAATDAIKKLQEIAAKVHGGRPEQYVVANERVVGPRRQHDARAGGAESDRARRQVRRP